MELDLNDTDFFNAATGKYSQKAEAGFLRLEADIANGSAIGIRPVATTEEDVEPERWDGQS